MNIFNIYSFNNVHSSNKFVKRKKDLSVRDEIMNGNEDKKRTVSVKNTFINYSMFKPNLLLDKNGERCISSSKGINNYNEKLGNNIASISNKKIAKGNARSLHNHIVSKSGITHIIKPTMK